MFFKCRACAAHEAHIQSLIGQVADLRRLTIPSPQSVEVLPPWEDVEPPAQDMSDVEPTPQERQELVDAEASRLLSGTYE